jgi:hypothetical protein
MHRSNTFCALPAVALAAVLAWGSPLAAVAAGTPEQQCEAAQNDAVGKYAACMAKAEKSKVLDGDLARYATAITKCNYKMFAAWNKAGSKAAAEGAACPASVGRGPIQDFEDACGTSIAAAVAGGALALDPITCDDDLTTCEDGVAQCTSDLATCEDDLTDGEADLSACEGDVEACEGVAAEPLAGTSQTLCYDTAGTAIACTGTGQDGDIQAGHTPVFKDNGDGTITDLGTGLMWEKLSRDGSIHQYDAVYTLTNAYGKIASLNSASFAGHNDWRMPNIRELESILEVGRHSPAVDPVFHTNCIASCTVLTCSCTRLDVHFSSTTYRMVPSAQWKINFHDGDVYAGNKTDTEIVRAVRDAY